jgi:uncharacterized protein (TIGR02246 family)
MKQAISGVLSLLLFCIITPVLAGDEEDVAAAMNMWQDSLAVGCAEDPGKILALYADDGILWGTLSSTLRDTPEEIDDYFVNACQKLPKLTVVFEDPHIRVFGDTALNTGYYTFSYEKDGQTVTLPARYSFAYVKRDGQWLIADHHSSGMPAP